MENREEAKDNKIKVGSKLKSEGIVSYVRVKVSTFDRKISWTNYLKQFRFLA